MILILLFTKVISPKGQRKYINDIETQLKVRNCLLAKADLFQLQVIWILYRYFPGIPYLRINPNRPQMLNIF